MMKEASDKMQITLKTLTPLWTGGVDQICDRLHETGLIGSLRWWYEALVRGLGGYACDPTSDARCEYDPKKPAPPEKQLCPACYLFGATGWGRKFRLQVINEKGVLMQDALKKDVTFVLRFVELRLMTDGEKWLLAKAVEIAAKYGALGGKTTLKPQKGVRKGADYGIVQWVEARDVSAVSVKQARAYLKQFLAKAQEDYPDLRWFFFVQNAFLVRIQLNDLLGRDSEGNSIENAADWQKFLQGKPGSQTDPAVSKKLFSFRTGGGRIYGYAHDARMRDTIIEQIREKLGNGNYTIRTGEEVLNEL
jgi:CRISPR-associated protein Cmr1